jgi:S1-C subfamily serine protease
MSSGEVSPIGRAGSHADASPQHVPDQDAFSTLEVPTDTGRSDDAEDQASGSASSPAESAGEGRALGDAASYEADNPDFDEDDVQNSWIGLSLRRDRRKLNSGEYATGLLVVDVEAGSPAQKAGLQPFAIGKAKTAAEIAAVAAGMMFPPVMIGVGIISSSQLDESYDLIIGVDGDRIVNMADFEDHLRILQPGEMVYLNVVRNGLRLQIPVSIPPRIRAPYGY